MSAVRKILLMVIFGFIGVVLQGSVLHPMVPAYLIPNFVLITVVFLGLHEVTVLGAVLAFILGVELDLFSGVLLGPWAASFTIVYGLLALIAQRMFLESTLTIFLSVLGSNVLANLTYLGLILQFKPVHGETLTVSVIEAGISAIVAPLVFKLLSPWWTPRTTKGSSTRRSTQRVFSAVRQ